MKVRPSRVLPQKRCAKPRNHVDSFSGIERLLLLPVTALRSLQLSRSCECVPSAFRTRESSCTLERQYSRLAEHTVKRIDTGTYIEVDRFGYAARDIAR
jgi:hypothetical protein